MSTMLFMMAFVSPRGTMPDEMAGCVTEIVLSSL